MTDLRKQLQNVRDLDDESLLRSLKRHVGSANRLNAVLLAHLAEVDARGAYRKWACQTLAAYCVYELRLSEDEAQRRCRAARVMREFPVLFEMIADGAIHLTGILLLAPYLTRENHQGVLVRARYRRKREIERLVAELAPACDVPALVQPLGVAMGTKTIPGKSWAALTESSLGWVRRLEPGDGPSNAPSATEEAHADVMRKIDADADVDSAPLADASAHTDTDTCAGTALAAPARHEAPLRFKVQFTADQAYVDLLERARALLWHQLPNGDLRELQRLALEALVEKLERRKCGAPARAGGSARAVAGVPRPTNSDSGAAGASQAPPSGNASELAAGNRNSAPARNADVSDERVASRDAAGPPRAVSPDPAPARIPSRHIPAAIRSQVWERDGGQCAYVDARGVRCRALSALEFHHEQPHARGGPSSADNLSLRCRAHNQLAAEQDFGVAFMQATMQARGGGVQGRRDSGRGNEAAQGASRMTWNSCDVRAMFASPSQWGC